MSTEDTVEKEECKFCGALVESPCDYSPPDFCEKAANYSTKEDTYDGPATAPNNETEIK